MAHLTPEPALCQPDLLTDIIRAVLWLLCMGWAGLVVLGHLVGGGHDVSAIQQAARAAESAFWVIFAYVCCRAVDSALRALAGSRGGA